MFKSSERLRHEAAQRSLDRVASTWRSSRTTWFDGTPESIDMRLAATDRLLAVARSGFTPAHLELTVEAENARRELLAAKHQLLADFLDDSARAFRGSKRVASELNWDDEDPELARLREETGWDEDGDSDVHPNAREDVPDPRLLSNFDKFVQSGELPSADAMREDIARWTGKEGSSRIAERGLRECINCGGSLSGEEDDDKDSECGHCGESAHHPRSERKSHIHEARGYQENEDWEEGGHYGDYNGKCPHCKSDNIDAGGYHGSGEYDCYDCGKTFHPKVRKFKSNVHTAGYYDYENDADGGWDRYVEQRLAPKSVGEETTVDGHPVHTFSSTGQAYNDTQTNENIKTGDILHIPSEGVVGMADTWPVAVTKNSGQLHAYGPDVHTDPSVLDTEEFQKYRGPNSDHFRRALQFAQQNGYETGPHEGQ